MGCDLPSTGGTFAIARFTVVIDDEVLGGSQLVITGSNMTR